MLNKKYQDDPTPVPFADQDGHAPTLQSAREGNRLYLRLNYEDRVTYESFPGGLSTADALSWLAEWHKKYHFHARP